MTTLVIGATGATGKQLVAQLLKMGESLKVIIRPSGEIPDEWNNNDNISIIKAIISEINVDEMISHLKGCQSVASCLGHNITLKGIFGKPRKLVTNSVGLICKAIQNNLPEKPIKFVLMNTTANSNRNLNEPVSKGEKIVMGLIRLLVPPQSDNEKAVDILRVDIGQNHKFIEWVAVRPDTLINEDNVSKYMLYPSPIRSALFKPGKTSRINVGHFMAKLIVDANLWEQWKGQMPVIYNSGELD